MTHSKQTTMTKEDKAKTYISCFYPSQQHPTQAMQTAFLDGHNTAEQSIDEMMCKFAEWVNTKWHQWEQGGSHKYTSLYEGDDNEYTTKELLDLFKQSLKQ
jgi:hypothetical protein